jgi:hypothetical protein
MVLGGALSGLRIVLFQFLEQITDPSSLFVIFLLHELLELSFELFSFRLDRIFLLSCRLFGDGCNGYTSFVDDGLSNEDRAFYPYCRAIESDGRASTAMSSPFFPSMSFE